MSRSGAGSWDSSERPAGSDAPGPTRSGNLLPRLCLRSLGHDGRDQPTLDEDAAHTALACRLPHKSADERMWPDPGLSSRGKLDGRVLAMFLNSEFGVPQLRDESTRTLFGP